MYSYAQRRSSTALYSVLLVLWALEKLPSNQSFDKQISGHKMGGGIIGMG